MRILIVGLGYAGRRYQLAFAHLASKLEIHLEMAYVSRRARESDLPYYSQVPQALAEFLPDIVVVSVNDHSHIDILRHLDGFDGFVICEKPLATPGDDWIQACEGLAGAKGFALDLVERYSDATRHIKHLVAQNNWSLIRASFHWGKDRLNDYRPTCGVTSEVIHALDLVQWIATPGDSLTLRQVIGVSSDFSISGSDVLDTVLLTASVGDAVVAGYSSFVNVQRQRTVDFSFVDPAGHVLHASIVYDTPAWDHDHLRIWTRDTRGREVLVEEQRITPMETDPATLHKLSRLCEDVLRVAVMGQPSYQPFADLEHAMLLQRLLDAIGQQVAEPFNARYLRNSTRILVPENADFESLG